MPSLYKAAAGTLIRETVQSASIVAVDGLTALLQGGRMLATSMHIDRGEDVQFLKTLSNLYYVYSFGEAPGKIMIGGLLFFVECGSPTGNSQVIADINNYYEQKRAYKGDTTKIAVGGASFNTVLTNLSIAADMTPYNYASFSLGFTLIPAK